MSSRGTMVLRFLAAPTDVAVGGSTVQAGRVLEWIDKAGFACAVGWSGGYCVTAYVGDVRFTRPIPAGSLIEAHAKLIYTGSTSMHILVSVLSANPRSGRYEEATECLLVFVAVDDAGAPRRVPEWTPSTDEERAFHAAAAERIPIRSEIKKEVARTTYTAAGSGPQMIFRFLTAPTDANWSGKTHGGTVMAWIDETAFACATGWCRQNTAAVYAGGIHFHRPIPVGHLLEIEARLLMTGTSSMHIGLRVRAADPKDQVMHLAAQCLSVFVALDDDGRAVPVPAYTPATDEDEALQRHAQRLKELREGMPVLDLRP
ncbi:acyl-CoA thioesterase [uncultured Arthrobacter sp.]|uniref:acyl-CoA thioesterase n=1 Tax=uncultured Arthrobacter sp. TaxID=114050 RepID=UPI0025D40D75|nr:acyl-CoA thioesterase [uncultured Arthrobacter sp.]